LLFNSLFKSYLFEFELTKQPTSRQMTNSIDRQGSLEKLTSIETTAKSLLNALIKKPDDQPLSLDGIHREELLNQTKTFLSQAKVSIVDIANSFHLQTDGFFDQKATTDDDE